MNAKLALCFIVAALASGCTGTPTWDTSVFPNQVVYGGPGSNAPAPVAAAIPAK
jgi:hypothetical protein